MANLIKKHVNNLAEIFCFYNTTYCPKQLYKSDLIIFM